MRSSTLIPRFLTTIPLARLALAGLVGLAASACNPEEDPEWTLVLQTDAVALTEDGTDQAEVIVSLLDQNFNPPAIGASVRLLADGANINDSGLPVGQSVTDALGYARFTVSCTNSNPLTVIAQFEGSTGVLRPPPGATASISCLPAPAGDWTLSISADPRRISPGQSAAISVVAVDGDREPVTTSPAIRMQITSGPLTFARGGTELLRTADGQGRFDATVVAPTDSGDATGTICASFNDPRFGATPSCVGIVISSATVTEAACVVAYGASRVPADNTSVTSATFSITDAAGTPVQNARINAAIASGTFLADAGGAPIGPTFEGTTNTSGDAVTYIRSPATPGSAALVATATFTQDGVEQTLSCSSPDDLVFFGPPQCTFGGIEPANLGVQLSGLDEQGELTFCFVQSDGSPVGAGRRVDFGLDLSLPGARLAASSALTDETGCASVFITAGTQAGTVVVRATLDFGSLDSTCTSDPILFRGGLPVGHDFALRCENEDAGVLIRSAGDQIFTDCSVECWMYLRDQWGNPVDRPDVSVFFATEQGIITNVATPNAEGRVSARFQPNGGLPSDVAPLANEPRIVSALGEVRNPRDMWVTITAFTTGSEGFFDDNGNGVRDDGEVWIDLPEPFVDANDNDQYNPGVPNFERFFDVRTPDRDFNGEWDGPNEQFDPVTTIWTRTAVRLTDSPIVGEVGSYGFVRDTAAGVLSPPVFSYWLEPSFFGDSSATLGSLFALASTAGAAVVNSFAFVPVDQYLNPVSPNTTDVTFNLADGCGELDSESSVVSSLPFLFSMERAGFRIGGTASETAPDYYRWRTNIEFFNAGAARYGATSFNILSTPVPFTVVAPEAASGATCPLSTQVTSVESATCSGVSLEVVHPSSVSVGL